MQTRRSLIRSGIIAASGLAVCTAIPGFAQNATPEDELPTIWSQGNSVSNNLPESAIAEPGTVQIVGVSPVLYPELAVVLVHNNTDKPVMLDAIRGTLRAPSMPELEKFTVAYNVPAVALKSGEYWIAKLKVPEELVVGDAVQFYGTAYLHTNLDSVRVVVALLPTVAPEGEFKLPESGEPWPIRYQDLVRYRTADLVQYHQVFFDDAGEICGFLDSDDRYDADGVAEFRMQLTNTLTMSTGGAVVGEMSDRWLGYWYHSPDKQWFAGFEF